MKYISNKILLTVPLLIAIILLVAFYLTYTSPSNQIESNATGLPLYVEIPKINVEANIEPAGLAEDGTLAVPDGPKGITWYKYGAKPGEKGSAVITGHYGPWVSGEGSVFDNLDELEKGDKVYIKDDAGKTLTFQVLEKKTYELGEIVPEVFVKDDGSYLNIITCKGQWLKDQKTFTNRLVVFTTLVE